MASMASSSSQSSHPAVEPPSLFHPPAPLMYKNRLQEFASRSSIAIPLYQTINEGQPHLPKFRSTVWVAGISYTSQATFSQKKAAEQEAARLALESILQRTRDEGPSLVSEISPLCKSILNEYAAKLHVEGPTYNTVQQPLGGLLPVFTTSLVFNGSSYTGDSARTKKEAEQSAAQAAILSIMGDSSSGTKLIEIIKSKSIFYDAMKGKGLPLLQASAVLSTTNAGDISVTLDHKDTRVVASLVENNNEAKVQFTEPSEIFSTANDGDISVTLDHKDTGGAGSVADNNNEAKVEFTEPSEILSTCQEFQMPKQDSSPEATNVSLQPGSAHSIDNGSNSKKRKKNKKKATKKLRMESSLPITAVPMNQASPCAEVPVSQVSPSTAAVPMNQVPPCSVTQ